MTVFSHFYQNVVFDPIQLIEIFQPTVLVVKLEWDKDTFSRLLISVNSMPQF